MNKKESPSLRNMPTGFKKHSGRCSFDAPQIVWGMNDFDELEIYRRDGTTKILQVYEIDWTASFLPEDIVGWRKLNAKI